MGISDSLAPATGMFGSGLAKLATYSWVLIPLVLILTIGFVFFIVKKIKKKKTQWTHTLKVRRVLNNTGRLSDEIIHKMRRFPLIKKAEVFELEKPLLGGYLIPELKEYSGLNEYSIIIDLNNRIWMNEGDYFNPDKNSCNVSGRHAEIDIQRANLKANFQNINKRTRRIEWATIAKYAFMGLALIVACIVLIVGLQKWGDAQEYKAQQAQAEAQAMENLATAMSTIEGTVNTQQIQIKKMLEAMYGKNIQSILSED